ncbi:MAG: hypothetical protein ACRC30_06530 [Clostridium sp.]
MNNIKLYSNKKKLAEPLVTLKNKKISIEMLLDSIAKSFMIDKSISEVTEELSHINRSFKRLNKECLVLEKQYKQDVLRYLQIYSQENNIDTNSNNFKRTLNKIPFEITEIIRKKFSKLIVKEEKIISLKSYHNELLKEKDLIEQNIIIQSRNFFQNKPLTRIELQIHLETLLEEINIKIIEFEY